VVDHLALAVEGVEDPPDDEPQVHDQNLPLPRVKEEEEARIPMSESPVGGDW
jgi:hypothetical protein